MTELLIHLLFNFYMMMISALYEVSESQTISASLIVQPQQSIDNLFGATYLFSGTYSTNILYF
jgi:hypothetical protein